MNIKRTYAVLIIILFALFAFIINYLTPLHSDDFFFIMEKRTFKGQIDFYNSWSGRVVANLTGFVILTFSKYKIVLAVVQTLGFTALLYYVSQIPFKIKRQPLSIVSFIAISILYWEYHPDLGQSTFWIVGAATYMWTNLFITIYLFYLLNYYYQEKINILIFPLALLAGCSNENTAIFVVGITFLIIFLKFFESKKFNFSVLVALMVNILGVIILIFAPGNKARMMIESPEWHKISAITKLQNYFSNGILESGYLTILKTPIIILMIIYVLIFLFNGIKIIDKSKRLTYLFWSVIFALASLASEIVMSQAPFYPPRSMSGPFLFLLISLSFAICELKKIEIVNGRIKYFIVGVLIIFSIQFIGLYIYKVYPLYKTLAAQNQFQQEVIKKAKKKGEKQVAIPRFFINEDFPERIVIDRYENPVQLAKYYGFDKFEYYDSFFDFSKITDEHKIASNQKLLTDNGLKNVYAYKRPSNITNFIFEFSEEEKNARKDFQAIYLHIYDKDGNMHNHDLGRVEPVSFTNRYILFRDVNINYNNIDRIEIGYFDVKEWHIRYTENIVIKL